MGCSFIWDDVDTHFVIGGHCMNSVFQVYSYNNPTSPIVSINLKSMGIVSSIGLSNLKSMYGESRLVV